MKSVSMIYSCLSYSRRALIGAALALPVVLGLVSCGGVNAPIAPSSWVASWYAAPQKYDEPPLSGAQAKSFQNQTYRQIMTVSAGGTNVRVRVSNLLGTAPLRIANMRIAKRTSGSSIDASTDTAVTFNGQTSVIVPVGQEMNSDSVAFSLASLDSVALSTYVSSAVAVETVHTLGLQSNYVAAGDVTSSAAIAPNETNSFYTWITGIDVYNASTKKVVVAFGDSITDGFSSTPNQNKRYPDFLSRSLLSGANGAAFSVVNAAIAGNRWSFDGIGPNGNGRFSRDALDRSGATHVVILLGINDFGLPSLLGNSAEQVPASLITQSIVSAAAAAKAKGVKVYVGTLTPFFGVTYPGYYTAEGEAKRQAVNAFIRSTNLIDGVIDFEAVIKDPANPIAMLAKYDSGDHLHPNDAGYEAMAASAAATLSK